LEENTGFSKRREGVAVKGRRGGVRGSGEWGTEYRENEADEKTVERRLGIRVPKFFSEGRGGELNSLQRDEYFVGRKVRRSW